MRESTRRKTYPWVRGPTWVDGVDLPPDQFNAEPRVGDVAAFRSGTMLARRIALRAILPFIQDETSPLIAVDQQSLVAAGVVGGQLPGVTPWGWGVAKFDYRWHFFRVASEPRYLIFGRGLHGWMMHDARLRVSRPQPGRSLAMTFEVPAWLPIRYPVTIAASSGGRTVATVVAAQAGYYKLILPLDIAGDTKISIDSCATVGEPRTDPPHPHCYRLIATAEEGPGS